MGTQAVARRLQSRPRLYRFARAAWSRGVEFLPANEISGIPGKVHPGDLMLDSRRDPEAIERYARAGRTAVEFLEQASGGRMCTPLDLGCGHGRVTRWLAQAVDPVRVTVTDLDASAVRFCVREFGVRGFVSSTDPSSLESTSDHDAVWMGSVLTHLDRGAALALLGAVRRITSPEAPVVVTQHSPELLGNFALSMSWLAERRVALEASLASSGWAYADYPHHGAGYGLTFVTDEEMGRVAETLGMSAALVQRKGWLEQDVWVLRAAELTGL